ncbi:MAG TPA: hypothetical protein VGA04_29135 [Streptosporangiaceae bacterium]
MPLPQVNERIKEVPAQALRAVFAGIGQVLLVADKIRNRAVEQVSGTTAATTTTAATAPPREAPPTAPAAAPSTAPAEPQAETTPAEPQAKTTPAEPQAEPDGARRRSLDETGNVRLISPDDEAAEPAASAPPTPDITAPGSDAPPANQAPVAPQAPAAPEATEPGALPLSNYDELTIASLRARLRVLSPSQISILLEYEKVTEGRPAVITMFERRLAKLEQEGS